MRRAVIVLALLTASGVAAAQIRCRTDWWRDNRRVVLCESTEDFCGDGRPDEPRVRCTPAPAMFCFSEDESRSCFATMAVCNRARAHVINREHGEPTQCRRYSAASQRRPDLGPMPNKADAGPG